MAVPRHVRTARQGKGRGPNVNRPFNCMLPTCMRCRHRGHGPFRGRQAPQRMSGSNTSTHPAARGRAAASRLTEVVTTAVPAGHRQPSKPGQNLPVEIRRRWPVPIYRKYHQPRCGVYLTNPQLRLHKPDSDRRQRHRVSPHPGTALHRPFRNWSEADQRQEHEDANSGG